jgi:nitrate reductase NapE component
MPSDNFPGRPGGFGPTEQIWYCDQCNAEIGRGFTKPEYIGKCPKCGVTFDNTAAGRSQAIRDQMSGGGMNFGNTPATPPTAASTVTGISILIILVACIVGVLALAGTIWFIVWLVQTVSAPAPRRVARRPRPRRSDYNL